MAQEIERKFLIKTDRWQELNKPHGDLYRQGYLSTDPNNTIRIRLTESAAWLTIKGLTKGASRREYEYAIPHEDAREMLDNQATHELSKTRYKITYASKLWEVDVFHGDNSGLIMAEIELESEDEQFELPGWVGEEVTGIERYYNSNLAVHPFNSW